MKIKLRPYQQTAVDSVISEWDTGNLSTLVQMTMGMGKTETFLGVLAHEIKTTPDFRALVIAHRQELIHQPVERVKKGWYERLPAPGIVQGSNNEKDKQIIIATIQTLQRRKKNGEDYGRFNRLRELLEHGRFTHLIIDECHHAVADSYMKLIRALRWLNPDLKHLGVTATPKRGDDKILRKVYSSVAYRKGLKEAIEELGVLCPFVAMGFTLPGSLKKVDVIAGDYAIGQLDELMKAENAIEIIVEKWLEHGQDRQTIAFMPGVKSARALAIAFNAAGVRAGFAHAGTPKKERWQIISDFKQGRTKVLVNCMLWTEGFDVPSIESVITARPTQNDSLYLQMVGRGLRTYPGKKDCLIMDFAPIGGRDLIGAGDLLGVSRKAKEAKQMAMDEDTVLDVFGLYQEETGIDADPDEVEMMILDFFANRTPLRFTHDGKVSTASVNKEQTIAVVLPQDDRIEVAQIMMESIQWSSKLEEAFNAVSGFQVAVIENRRAALLELCDSWDTALDIANDWSVERMEDVLANKNTRWRKTPASDKQELLCKKLSVWADGMTKGQAAQAITHKFALNALCYGGFIK